MTNMESLQSVCEAIENYGFDEQTIKLIDNYANNIQDGKANLHRFNLPEHAGLCKAGKVLIGASIVASYATASLTTGCNAESCQGKPANWQIDELQEKLIEQWAKAAQLWVENSEQISPSLSLIHGILEGLFCFHFMFLFVFCEIIRNFAS